MPLPSSSAPPAAQNGPCSGPLFFQWNLGPCLFPVPSAPHTHSRQPASVYHLLKSSESARFHLQHARLGTDAHACSLQSVQLDFYTSPALPPARRPRTPRSTFASDANSTMEPNKPSCLWRHLLLGGPLSFLLSFAVRVGNRYLKPKGFLFSPSAMFHSQHQIAGATSGYC